MDIRPSPTPGPAAESRRKQLLVGQGKAMLFHPLHRCVETSLLEPSVNELA
jgi:hypothetical protein